MQRAGQFLTFGGRPTQSGVTLQEIISDLALTSGLQGCWDAGDSTSWTGSGNWQDLSGNSRTLTRTGATFNGVVGGGSRNEFFSFDGSDVFTRAVETWMTAMHGDNAAFSIVAIYRPPSSGTKYILDTCATSGRNGVVLGGLAGDEAWLGVGNAAGTHAALSAQTTATLTDSQFNFVGMSLNEASSASGVWQANGTQETGWNPTYTSPSATACGGLYVGGTVVGGFTANGSGLAALAIWNTNLTEANFAAIKAAWEAGKSVTFPYT